MRSSKNAAIGVAVSVTEQRPDLAELVRQCRVFTFEGPNASSVVTLGPLDVRDLPDGAIATLMHCRTTKPGQTLAWDIALVAGFHRGVLVSAGVHPGPAGRPVRPAPGRRAGRRLPCPDRRSGPLSRAGAAPRARCRGQSARHGSAPVAVAGAGPGRPRRRCRAGRGRPAQGKLELLGAAPVDVGHREPIGVSPRRRSAERSPPPGTRRRQQRRGRRGGPGQRVASG